MVQRYANPRDNVLCCALQAEVTAMSIAARQGNVAEIAKRAAAVMDYAGAQIITQVDHNARSDVAISVLNAAQYLAAIPALMTMFRLTAHAAPPMLLSVRPTRYTVSSQAMRSARTRGLKLRTSSVNIFRRLPAAICATLRRLSWMMLKVPVVLAGIEDDNA
ncbi:hypothetical protein PC128_g26 [Phytophthora cactorum]|nr:hypothetical protein PC128_g26 [Phytophthora cactorum]